MLTEEDKKLFVHAILDLVELIPIGRVTSYKKLATAAGYGEYSRLVGRIMSGTDSLRTGIPAHRVVASSGILTGRKAFGPGNEMSELLQGEGVKVVNNRICNVQQIMWDPLEEL